MFYYYPYFTIEEVGTERLIYPSYTATRIAAVYRLVLCHS